MFVLLWRIEHTETKTIVHNQDFMVVKIRLYRVLFYTIEMK